MGVFTLMSYPVCLISSLYCSWRRRLALPVISYHNNGTILANPIKVHVVWYGTFTDGMKTLITNFIDSLGDKSDPSNTREWPSTCHGQFGMWSDHSGHVHFIPFSTLML